jgi:hypothetical protein
MIDPQVKVPAQKLHDIIVKWMPLYTRSFFYDKGQEQKEKEKEIGKSK